MSIIRLLWLWLPRRAARKLRPDNNSPLRHGRPCAPRRRQRRITRAGQLYLSGSHCMQVAERMIAGAGWRLIDEADNRCPHGRRGKTSPYRLAEVVKHAGPVSRTAARPEYHA
jgi:hypothetical protein